MEHKENSHLTKKGHFFQRNFISICVENSLEKKKYKKFVKEGERKLDMVYLMKRRLIKKNFAIYIF